MNWIIYLATAAVVAICAIVTLLWVAVTITNMFDANFGNEDNDQEQVRQSPLSADWQRGRRACGGVDRQQNHAVPIRRIIRR